LAETIKFFIVLFCRVGKLVFFLWEKSFNKDSLPHATISHNPKKVISSAGA